MNDAMAMVGLVVSLGGAIGAVISAAVGLRNSRKIDGLDGKVNMLSGRVDEQGKILQAVVGALLKPKLP